MGKNGGVLRQEEGIKSFQAGKAGVGKRLLGGIHNDSRGGGIPLQETVISAAALVKQLHNPHCCLIRA